MDGMAKISRITPDVEFSEQIAMDQAIQRTQTCSPRGVLGEVKEEPEEFYSQTKDRRAKASIR